MWNHFRYIKIIYLKNWFHEILKNRYKMHTHIVEKWKKFRQINNLVISLLKTLLSRNFHTALCGTLYNKMRLRFFCQINFLTIEVPKELISRIFLSMIAFDSTFIEKKISTLLCTWNNFLPIWMKSLIPGEGSILA